MVDCFLELHVFLRLSPAKCSPPVTYELYWLEECSVTNVLCYALSFVLTLTDVEISQPPCSFFMFQYQAFSDDLNSPVCVPDVTLCETLVTRKKSKDQHHNSFHFFIHFPSL